MSIPVLRSAGVRDDELYLDPPHKDLLAALVQRLETGQLTPASQPGLPDPVVADRSDECAVPPPSNSKKWWLAERNVESWRLNPGLGDVPKQFFLIWSCGVWRGAQCIQLWRVVGFRSLRTARLAVANELSLSNVEHLKLCLRRGVDLRTSGASGRRSGPRVADDTELVAPLRFHAEELRLARNEGWTKFFGSDVVMAEGAAAGGEVLAGAGSPSGGSHGDRHQQGPRLRRARPAVVLSEEQQTAVDVVGPLLLQGRAGTAKTTILVERGARHLEQNTTWPPEDTPPMSSLSAEDHHHDPLVLFVTASARLARTVQQQFHDVFGGALGSVADPPRCLLDVPPGPRALFLTFGEFCRMLDASIPDGEYFFERSSAESALHIWDRFSDGENGNVGRGKAVRTRFQHSPDAEVTYADFVGRYWSKLPQNMRKNFNPHDVYKEILLIKTGTSAGNKINTSSPDSLSRAEYVGNPPPDSLTRVQALYSERDRTRIYDVFERYQKMLGENRQFDCVDVADCLWARAQRYAARERNLRTADDGDGIIAQEEPRHGRDEKQSATPARSASSSLLGFEGRVVTCLLVDESQDLLLKQLLLFTLVCPNLCGHAFAADPAQCIAAGRSFRLAAVKEIWNKASSAIGGGVIAKNDVRERSVTTTSTTLCLTKNYRTHQGILDFAARIVHILVRNFPGAVPQLPREISPFMGESPVLVTNVETLTFVELLMGAVTPGATVVRAQNRPQLPHISHRITTSPHTLL